MAAAMRQAAVRLRSQLVRPVAQRFPVAKACAAPPGRGGDGSRCVAASAPSACRASGPRRRARPAAAAPPEAKGGGGEISAALAAALEGVSAPSVRLAAVRSLAAELSADESDRQKPAAEAALHRVLTGAQGAGAPQLREAAAEALWSSWHHSASKDVGERMRLGFAFMEKKHFEEAVKAFTEVTELEPSFVGGWNQRAMAQFSLRRFELAIRDCGKVLELKPRHFGSLAMLGMCHKGRGDSKSAMRYFNECLGVHPGLESLKGVLGHLELQITRTEISKHLWPRVAQAVHGLDLGALAPGSGQDWLACDWDVCRLLRKPGEDEDGALHYVFRVRIENRGSSSGSPGDAENRVRSLARFYVLRFVGGDVFPLTRLNNGPRILELGPGQACRFAFKLLVAGPLRDAAGGMLLERSGATGSEAGAGEARGSGIADCVLPIVEPQEATGDEVERLRLGYTDVGELDVRKFKLRKGGQSKA